MDTVHFTEHLRHSVLIKRFHYLTHLDLIDAGRRHVLNAEHMAQTGSIFAYCGNDVQCINIEQGSVLIAPLNYERNEMIYSIGGNVVYLKYIVDGELYEKTFISDEMMGWMDLSHHGMCNKIDDEFIKFMLFYRYGSFKKRRWKNHFNMILDEVSEITLVKSATYDKEY